MESDLESELTRDSWRGAAAFRGMPALRMPSGRSFTPLANVPNRECRDSPPELVIRGKDSVVAMLVLPRRRNKVGKPAQELKRRECDVAARAGPTTVPMIPQGVD
jgi:hypothetical protein